jgi:hypothetical protein
LAFYVVDAADALEEYTEAKLRYDTQLERNVE